VSSLGLATDRLSLRGKPWCDSGGNFRRTNDGIGHAYGSGVNPRITTPPPQRKNRRRTCATGTVLPRHAPAVLSLLCLKRRG
jgi:hypothetical protein